MCTCRSYLISYKEKKYHNSYRAREKKKEKTILKIDRSIINKILHFDITLSRSIMKLINYIYISLIKQILNFTLYKRSLQKYYRKKIQLSKKLN